LLLAVRDILLDLGASQELGTIDGSAGITGAGEVGSGILDADEERNIDDLFKTKVDESVVMSLISLLRCVIGMRVSYIDTVVVAVLLESALGVSAVGGVLAPVDGDVVLAVGLEAGEHGGSKGEGAGDGDLG